MVAPRDIRKIVVERDGPHCRWCGRLTHEPALVGVSAPHTRTLDHIVPRSRGSAKWDLSNVVIACHECNQERGNLAVDEWAAVLIVRAAKGEVSAA